jgi:hypothetical protein
VMNRGKATEDYPLGAVGPPARRYGLQLDAFERQPEAPSRPAHSPGPVVFSNLIIRSVR